MIQVNVDKEQKLVETQITGFINSDEAVQVSTELKKALMQFGPKEAILLIDLVGIAPVNNDVLPILRGMGRDVVSYFRKAALVEEFPMDMGGRKVIEPPPGAKLPSFTNRDQAMAYLQTP